MAEYDTVIHYQIMARCTEPLHIGSADGVVGGLLLHPVGQRPFIQGTGIAGVFREHWDVKTRDRVLGTCEGHGQSKVIFSDAHFRAESLSVERRPRLAIDERMGVGKGEKFEMNYIAPGAVFTWNIYTMCRDEEQSGISSEIERILRMLHHGSIQFGGQKTNGCGYVALESVYRSSYDMRQKNERKMWASGEMASSENILEHILSERENQSRYRFLLTGKTDRMLVKGLAEEGFGLNAADAVNIVSRRDGKESCIIPASSIKGVCRHQAHKILSVLGGGSAAELFEGIYFYDAPVTEEVSGLRHRIKIDRFTGGVMNQMLFSEKPIGGNIEIRIEVSDKEQAIKKCALIILILRDIAAGLVTFGSERSIGQGYLDVSTIEFETPQGDRACIRPKEGSIEDENGIIRRMLDGLKGGCANE